MIKEISEKIKYVTSGENPLSSDVILIYGDKATWVFDVGANDEAFDTIEHLIYETLSEKEWNIQNELTGKRDVNIVISHFHRDHMGNLERIAKIPATGNRVNLYVSSYTNRYCKSGNIVDKEITIDDGVKIRIFPMESSHSKGC